MLLPGAALAGPTVSLIWTGTTGSSGTPGGSSIDAAQGDTLTLTVVIQDFEGGGVPFAGLSLLFDPDALQGGAAVRCPAPGSTPPGNNTLEGFCGANLMGSTWAPALAVDNTSGFVGPAQTGALTPVSAVADFDLLAIDFAVGALSATTKVDVYYVPGFNSVNGSNGGVHYPGASANVVFVPEPGEFALLLSGAATLFWLAWQRRRFRRVAPNRHGARVARQRATLLTISATLLLAFGASPPSWAVPDTDNDTIPDAADNCMLVSNPGSFHCDVDQDGYGNACDMDLNNDFIQSNLPDGVTFSALFGSMGTPSIADANCDQIVGGPDHGALIRAFGTPPGPSGLACAGFTPCP